MKKLIVAALAALALFGCDASDKAEKASAPPPQSVQTAPAPPAPQPVTVADIDACKDAWVETWAKEHHTTVAAAERYARRMPSTTPSWTYAGKTVTFTKTVWHSCEAAVRKARAAPVQARTAVQDSASAALIADLRAQNQRLAAENRGLRDLAYQNPEETDPTKLVPYQTVASDMERQRNDLNGFTVMDGLWGLLCFAIGFIFCVFIWPRLRRRKTNRTIGS